MDRQSKIWLLFTVGLSFLIWSLLISWKFSVAIIPAILFHEYGHYYWMGREGIQKRSMMMIPPFGAVAACQEPWPSREAETRIALAGPIFGFISAVGIFVLWQMFRYPILGATTYLICFFNMFNLLAPIPILDGGRVIKSILCSMDEKWGVLFYYFGFMVLLASFIWIPGAGLIATVIGYLLYKDFQYHRMLPQILSNSRLALGLLAFVDREKILYDDKDQEEDVVKSIFFASGLEWVPEKNKSGLEKVIKDLELRINPPGMNLSQAVNHFFVYLSLNLCYVILFLQLTNVNFSNYLSFFK
ncbi:MAG: hypothetical protein A3C71_00155 [Candidatus Yanofskybacteria bacterium RIFCSPHIGHO2_02_FULL_43_15c]|uniref:Peptidase M50 domain-containing protein n=1 Tax=Candidatus Yanofskybacteria bacterium RIFCSPHIGHO2_02_FULL_43_15c TaxID=1802679 RepID=A0A1F8FHN4_9BACT|nr:MAG: hypothetical protein A3C71_00155 [Candidatus Yanofskybacteria bacterium RIFCSPHIGHO2_02_FULL_43_15c]